MLFFKLAAIFYQNVLLIFFNKKICYVLIIFLKGTSHLTISSEKNKEMLAWYRHEILYWKHHFLSRAVILCQLLSHTFISCHSLHHSLSLLVPLVVTRCATCCQWLYHSLPFVVTHCHSLSLVAPLVVLRCTTSVFLINDPKNLLGCQFYFWNHDWNHFILTPKLSN